MNSTSMYRFYGRAYVCVERGVQVFVRNMAHWVYGNDLGVKKLTLKRTIATWRILSTSEQSQVE
jgi:hypothetical protein